jgi:ClpP class serine protease
MRYPHLLATLRAARWAIHPATLHAIAETLDQRLRGAPHADLPAPQTPISNLPTPISNSPTPALAIIPLHGIIARRMSAMEMECGGGRSLELIEQDIAAAIADPAVSEILLHIDSPGGTITGVPELHRRILRWREEKPIYAYTDGLCASAAYWIATACTALIATPSAEIGSVGVYMYALDTSVATAAAGFRPVLVKAGDRKAEGIRGLPIEPATIAAWQEEVDELYAAFVGDILAQRPGIPTEALQGQCHFAPAALAAGLIDATVNDLDELLAQLAQAAAATA